MLSVPTLWIIFVVNFIAIGVVWTHVVYSYPNQGAARFWMAASFCAAIGALVAMTRGFMDPDSHVLLVMPLVVGGSMLVFASALGGMGIQHFYGVPVSWRMTFLVTAINTVAVVYFLVWHDNMAARITIYSLCQATPMALTLPLVFSRKDGRKNPGARLAGYIAILMLGVYVFRSVASMFGIGGGTSIVSFNPLQASLILALVFLSMMWNFGFLLMTIDSLRAEVEDLALFDDLTGAANRRQLLARIEQECARAARTGDVCALLVIDLDGFKSVNDNHGHAAGDECLRQFSRVAQAQLRDGDLLARMGGDEFCVVLPSTTLREGAMMARRILESCKGETLQWNGTSLALAASIGVAQWRPEIGNHAEWLISAADQALYTAKNDGKNGYAVYDATPLGADVPLRRTA